MLRALADFLIDDWAILSLEGSSWQFRKPEDESR
jgi:hypothetical protein